jgi:hypothetical protein
VPNAPDANVAAATAAHPNFFMLFILFSPS